MSDRIIADRVVLKFSSTPNNPFSRRRGPRRTTAHFLLKRLEASENLMTKCAVVRRPPSSCFDPPTFPFVVLRQTLPAELFHRRCNPALLGSTRPGRLN